MLTENAIISVQTVPASVAVSDDRGSVDGVIATVRVDGKILAEGTVIPPEGTGIDCWVERCLYAPISNLLGFDAEEVIIDDLGRAAEAPACDVIRYQVTACGWLSPID